MLVSPAGFPAATAHTCLGTTCRRPGALLEGHPPHVCVFMYMYLHICMCTPHLSEASVTWAPPPCSPLCLGFSQTRTSPDLCECGRGCEFSGMGGGSGRGWETWCPAWCHLWPTSCILGRAQPTREVPNKYRAGILPTSTVALRLWSSCQSANT